MAGNDTKILTSYTSVQGDGGLNLWAGPAGQGGHHDVGLFDLQSTPRSDVDLSLRQPNDLEVIAPLVRLFFQQVVSILQRAMPTRTRFSRFCFLLDEFKHLGKARSDRDGGYDNRRL